jgi:hypothetical protein
MPLLYYLIVSLDKLQEFWFKDIGLNSLVSTIPYQFVQPESLTTYHIIFACIVLCIVAISFFINIKNRLFAYALFFVPVILVWLISQSTPMYHHRFFLFFALGLYLIIAQVFDMMLQHNKFIKSVGILLLVFSLYFLSYSFHYMTENPTDDIFKSTDFLKNRINKTDKIYFVHVNTFTQTPYKYYFRDYPNVKHYLSNNVTDKELFTAGGSIVKPEERITSSELPEHFYYITDTIHFQNESDNVIYDNGGLIIWQR